MKPLTRDILITLTFKFSLLLVLWLVCFKNVEKPTTSVEHWLLGSNTTLSSGTSPLS